MRTGKSPGRKRSVNSLARCYAAGNEREAAYSFRMEKEWWAAKIHRKVRELGEARVHRKENELGEAMVHRKESELGAQVKHLLNHKKLGFCSKTTGKLILKGRSKRQRHIVIISFRYISTPTIINRSFI